MRARAIVILGVLLLLTGVGFWWYLALCDKRREQKPTHQGPADSGSSTTENKNVALAPPLPTPRLFKSTRYPPVTAEETVLRAVPGAGFLFTNDELMFSAPEAGYRDEALLTRSAAEALTKSSIKARLYVKTVGGKFAAVELESILWERRNEATLNALIAFNPSGSRNLEFDLRKWINR